MRRFAFAFMITVLLLTGLVFVVSAQQGDVLARIQPLLVSVQQQVPVSVTLSIPLDDGEAQTVTVPMALDLNLEISLSSTMSPMVSVAAATSSIAVSDLPADPSRDNNDIAYEVETLGDIELVQVRTDMDYSGDFEITGEVRNTGDDALEVYDVQIAITVYDDSGHILDTYTTFADFGPIAPGRTSPFQATVSDTRLDDVASYRIQISADP